MIVVDTSHDKLSDLASEVSKKINISDKAKSTNSDKSSAKGGLEKAPCLPSSRRSSATAASSAGDKQEKVKISWKKTLKKRTRRWL